jgi:hypothetical protein
MGPPTGEHTWCYRSWRPCGVAEGPPLRMLRSGAWWNTRRLQRLQKILPRVILEHLRIPDVAAHGLDRAVARHVHDLEQPGARLGSRRDETGAQ